MDRRVFGIPTIPRHLAWEAVTCTLCPRVIRDGELCGTRDDRFNPVIYCDACCRDLEAAEERRG